MISHMWFVSRTSLVSQHEYGGVISNNELTHPTDPPNSQRAFSIQAGSNMLHGGGISLDHNSSLPEKRDNVQGLRIKAKSSTSLISTSEVVSIRNG